MRVRPWYNPDLRTANFIIPGLLAIILTFTLISFTAASIVRERELGTLEQLQVTPLTRTQLILGKIAPFLLIGYIQLTVVVLLMRFLFHIPIVGSLVALYLLSGIFIAAVLGLGIFISTIAKTQMQASQMAMFVLLPFVFLSGYVFPIDGMPTFFQYLTLRHPGELLPADRARHRAARRVVHGAVAADRVAVVLHAGDHQPGDRQVQEDRQLKRAETLDLCAGM